MNNAVPGYVSEGEGREVGREERISIKTREEGERSGYTEEKRRRGATTDSTKYIVFFFVWKQLFVEFSEVFFRQTTLNEINIW